MNIKILNGEVARTQFADVDWRRRWTNLHQICPWATSMQSLSFVELWYDSYQEKYAPVLVVSHNAENELVGLLALALESDTNRLVVAADYLCEYGTWLAANTATGNQFIVAALGALEKKFPNAVLQFLYLASGTSIDWLGENKAWRDKCKLKKEVRPLLRLDKAKLQASLEKKSNRSRLNQMKKRGAIEFEQVTDLNAFETIYDTVKSFSDLRLSAVHRVAPEANTIKKKFFLELFKADFLLVTLLKIGEEIASAHFDLKNGDSFLPGITAVSPFFAKYSPGKLHITFLCLELLKQNVHIYDLTPGGDYKDKHANSRDEIHVLTIYFNQRARRQSAAKRRVVAAAKKVLSLAKIDREVVDERIYQARHKLKFLTAKTIVQKIIARMRGVNRMTREMRFYTFDAEKIAGIPNPHLMNCDCIEDLLKYEPTDSWHLTASAFHRQVIERLSEGVHVYTKVEDDKLVHYGWMIERQEESFITEINQYLTMPPDSAVLFDFFTHPQARGKGFYQAALRQILHDACRIPNTRQVYIGVAADNGASRHSIEKVGFEYKCSLYS